MGAIFTVLAFAAMRLDIDLLSMHMLLLLLLGFVTGVYMLYDIRYMEIPDQIMVPAIYVLIAIPFFSILFTGYDGYTFHTFHIPVIDRLL